MFIDVYYSPHDSKVSAHNLLAHSNVFSKPIRELIHCSHSDQSVILIGSNSSTKKLINFIRTFNILTPIYVLDHFDNVPIGANGKIDHSQLTFSLLCEKLNAYPQRIIWPFVFNKDAIKRTQLIR